MVTPRKVAENTAVPSNKNARECDLSTMRTPRSRDAERRDSIEDSSSIRVYSILHWQDIGVCENRLSVVMNAQY